MADALNRNQRPMQAAGRMFPTPEAFMQAIDDGTALMLDPAMNREPDRNDAKPLKDVLAMVLSLTLNIGDPDSDDPGKIALAIKQAVLNAYNLGRLRK